MHSKKCVWFGHNYVFDNQSRNEPGIYPERCTRCEDERTRYDGQTSKNPRLIVKVVAIMGVVGVLTALAVYGVLVYTQSL